MKRDNPMMWAAWWALGFGLAAAIAGCFGQLGEHTVYTLAAGGFAWGYVVARIRNWMIRSLPS